MACCSWAEGRILLTLAHLVDRPHSYLCPGGSNPRAPAWSDGKCVLQIRTPDTQACCRARTAPFVVFLRVTETSDHRAISEPLNFRTTTPAPTSLCWGGSCARLSHQIMTIECINGSDSQLLLWEMRLHSLLRCRLAGIPF